MTRPVPNIIPKFLIFVNTSFFFCSSLKVMHMQFLSGCMVYTLISTVAEVGYRFLDDISRFKETTFNIFQFAIRVGMFPVMNVLHLFIIFHPVSKLNSNSFETSLKLLTRLKSSYSLLPEGPRHLVVLSLLQHLVAHQKCLQTFF